MKIIITISLFLIFLSEISSQNVLVSTKENEIFRLNENNSLTYVVTVLGLNSSITDIAICPDNKLYALNNNNIIEINILDGSFDVVTELPQVINTFGLDDSRYASLVCSNNHELYALENTTTVLYKYNILEDSISSLLTVGSYSPGDMTFYKGNLLIVQNGKIKAYNLQSETLKTIHCLSFGNYLLWGLTNDYTNCNENRIISSNSLSQLWELNIDSGVSNSFYDSELIKIYGLASINESLASNCNSEIEEIDCSVTSIQTTNKEDLKLTIYPNPVNDFFSLKTKLDIKKMEIYDINGKLSKTVISPFHEVDVRILKNGFYYLKCYSKLENTIIKFIKI